MIDPKEDLDLKFDHMDATGMHSVSEIRDALDMDGHDNSDFTAEAIQGRIGDNQKGGINVHAWAETLQNPDTKRATKAGISACRAAINNQQ